MTLQKYKIPIVVCLIFLITSPIGQMVFGYAGGFLAYLASEILPYSAHEVATELMLVLSLICLVGFFYVKNKIGLVITSVLSTFFICNTILFYAMNSKAMREYFYPDRYIIGAIVSLIILGILTRLKTKKPVANNA